MSDLRSGRHHPVVDTAMWILAAMQYTETPLSLHQCINITGYMQHRDNSG